MRSVRLSPHIRWRWRPRDRKTDRTPFIRRLHPLCWLHCNNPIDRPSNHIRSLLRRWWIDNNFDLATYCYWHVKSSFEYLWAECGWRVAEYAKRQWIKRGGGRGTRLKVLPNDLHLLTNILQLTFGNKHNSISTLQCQRWESLTQSINSIRHWMAKHLITFADARLLLNGIRLLHYNQSPSSTQLQPPQAFTHSLPHLSLWNYNYCLNKSPQLKLIILMWSDAFV